MNPLHSKDIEMSDPPKLSTIKREQSQDFQSEFIARRKAVHDLEAIVNKLYEQAQHVHAKALDELAEEESSFYSSFRRTLINLKHAFLNNIPAPNLILLKDVQPILFMILAIFAYGTVLGLFQYFFVSGIQTGVRMCRNTIIKILRIHTFTCTHFDIRSS